MGITVYTPDFNKHILHKAKVDFIKRGIDSTIHIVQYDSSIPLIEVSLFYDNKVYTIPEDNNINIKIRWGKSENHTYIYKNVLGCNQTRDKIYFNISDDMSSKYGEFNPILELIYENDDTKGLGSSEIKFIIDKNPIQRNGGVGV